MINPGSILLALALLLVVGLILARPFFVAHYRQEKLTEREVLEAQKEALLAQIRDLDFDHETGKLPDEVHAQRRAELVAEAAGVLKRLDQMQSADEQERREASTDGRAGVDQEIEAAIARLRRVQAATPHSGDGADAIETAVARLRQQPADGNGDAAQAERYCPQCGERRDAGDKFCAYCGHHFA